MAAAPSMDCAAGRRRALHGSGCCSLVRFGNANLEP